MEQKKQIPIKASDKVAQGRYANTMMVAHTKEEFAMDFLNIMPPQGNLVARIFTTPGHMKRIVKALGENLKKYEESFGEVEESDSPKEVGFKAE